MTMSINAENVRAAIGEIAAARPGTSIDPGEVARKLAGTDTKAWGRAMKPLRAVLLGLAKDGEIEFLRKGKPVAPEDLRGVYRLRVIKLALQ